ncbi:hypothetical protein [Ekhidna sp. To15]|uniref:hypothetical protein n=1 Tax=Ekhidna sp. To15 TaxID=3395267 RepID=UPI003F522289
MKKLFTFIFTASFLFSCSEPEVNTPEDSYTQSIITALSESRSVIAKLNPTSNENLELSIKELLSQNQKTIFDQGFEIGLTIVNTSNRARSTYEGINEALLVHKDQILEVVTTSDDLTYLNNKLYSKIEEVNQDESLLDSEKELLTTYLITIHFYTNYIYQNNSQGRTVSSILKCMGNMAWDGLSGGATGAWVGSLGGPIGSAIGGILGTAIGVYRGSQSEVCQGVA